MTSEHATSLSLQEKSLQYTHKEFPYDKQEMNTIRNPSFLPVSVVFQTTRQKDPTNAICCSSTCDYHNTELEEDIEYVLRSQCQDAQSLHLKERGVVYGVIAKHVLDIDRDYTHRFHTFFILKQRLPESTTLYLERYKQNLIASFIQNRIIQFLCTIRNKHISIKLSTLNVLLSDPIFVHAFSATHQEAQVSAKINILAALMADTIPGLLEPAIDSILEDMQKTEIHNKKYIDDTLQEIHTTLHQNSYGKQ